MAADKRQRAYSAYDYGSEYEPDSEVEKKRAKRADLSIKELPISECKPSKSTFVEERSRDEARYMRHHYVSTNAYARHKELVNNYLLYYGGKLSDFQDKSTHKTDQDIIRENHQFVWEQGDDIDSWDKQLAKRYYDKLYKEYCLADLSRYKENKIAMRWRVENEVISGKGQFICGNKRCDRDDGLRSWEVNFSYVEQGNKKNCLIKLRLCPKCSEKLNYSKQKRDVTKELKKDAGPLPQKDTAKSSHRSQQHITDIIDELLA